MKTKHLEIKMKQYYFTKWLESEKQIFSYKILRNDSEKAAPFQR